ncbi:tRNA lysidine(34) synthetase TilS [Mycoplasmopsis synoviae]|nr:tRNA lysidine(34) synthetase TilS [Mycoplasmopsis synoviae]AKB11332.1 hypothetical protein VY93_03365 [Mycoplasmopsis synoviae ATCC 25204]
METKYLIAVSGGADSMFLLDKYKHKNIVVAHVNYNQRNDSNFDEELVRNYCEKNNIKLEILSLNKQDFLKGNFQDWARKARYSFFEKVYKKHNCNKLLIAHHKLDFLETYYMQKESNKMNFFYGIKKRSFIFDMHVYRPFLYKYTKKQIYKFCRKNKIPYRDDYSNFESKYTRNIVRKLLLQKNLFLLNLTFFKVVLINFFKSFKYKKVTKKFENLKQHNFQIKDFKGRYLNELIYLYLSELNLDLNINKYKILSVKSFILSDKTNKEYLLEKKYYLQKKQNKIVLINKEN